MFSLIVTIISIALVAALAVATLYYGGSSYSEGRVKSDAIAMVNAAAQIKAANILYANDHGGTYATSISELTGAYLKSVPVPPSSASTEPYDIGGANSSVLLTMDGPQAKALCDVLVGKGYDCAAVEGSTTFKVEFVLAPAGTSTTKPFDAQTMWDAMMVMKSEALAGLATAPGSVVINRPEFDNSPYYPGFVNYAVGSQPTLPGGKAETQLYSLDGTRYTVVSYIIVEEMSVENCLLLASQGGMVGRPQELYGDPSTPAGCYIAPTEVGSFDSMEAEMQSMMGWVVSSEAEVKDLQSKGAKTMMMSGAPDAVFMKLIPSPTRNFVYLPVDSYIHN